jgi:hypothetical protein
VVLPTAWSKAGRARTGVPCSAVATRDSTQACGVPARRRTASVPVAGMRPMSSRPRTRAARVRPTGPGGHALRPSGACPSNPVPAVDCQPHRVRASHGTWRATLVTAMRAAIRQVPSWLDGTRTGVLNYRSPRDWIKHCEGTGAGCGVNRRSLAGAEIGAGAPGGAVLSFSDVELVRDIGRPGMPGFGQWASGREVKALGRVGAKAYPHVHLPAHRILSHRVPRRPLLLVDGRCRRCRHRRLNAWAAFVFDWSRVGLCWAPSPGGRASDGGRAGGNAHAA